MFFRVIEDEYEKILIVFEHGKISKPNCILFKADVERLIAVWNGDKE